jgi:hypothetical protein
MKQLDNMLFGGLMLDLAKGNPEKIVGWLTSLETGHEFLCHSLYKGSK